MVGLGYTECCDAIEIGRGPCLVHFGYRGCFEDHQQDYAEDHKCTVMATRVGLGQH